jgi:hypothetical protein
MTSCWSQSLANHRLPSPLTTTPLLTINHLALVILLNHHIFPGRNTIRTNPPCPRLPHPLPR